MRWWYFDRKGVKRIAFIPRMPQSNHDDDISRSFHACPIQTYYRTPSFPLKNQIHFTIPKSGWCRYVLCSRFDIGAVHDVVHAAGRILDITTV